MAYLSWLSLVVLRFWWACSPQTGYIHPDEFFQNPEPLAGDIFKFDVHRTWEFNKTQLARSMFFPSLTTGIPFLILKELADRNMIQITAPMLVIFPRLVMCLFSLATDYSVYEISKVLGLDAETNLLVLASSYVMLVHATHTFSNSIELGIFALILMVVVSSRRSLLCTKPSGKPDEQGTKKKIAKPDPQEEGLRNIRAAFFLGIFIVEGFFNRVTLAFFAVFPITFWLIGNSDLFSLSCVKVIIKNGLLMVPGALIHLCIHVAIDSVYAETLNPQLFSDFSYLVENLNVDLLKNLTLTPLNLMNYNFDPDNILLHGVHPRVTHFFVNLPLLFLPLMLCFASEMVSMAMKQTWVTKNDNLTSRMFFALSFFTPVLLISLFPHQEARFLLPVLVPLVILYAPFVTVRGLPNMPWLLWNIFGCLVFGVLHQGGLVPCMSHIGGMLKAPVAKAPISYHFVFFHTYMPPQHLLAWANKDLDGIDLTTTPHDQLPHNFTIHDMMGADRLALLSKVDSLMDNRKLSVPKPYKKEVYVISPASLDIIFCTKNILNNFRLVRAFSPHLCMEHIPHLFPSYMCVQEPDRSPAYMSMWYKVRFSFGLNMYKVEKVKMMAPASQSY